MEFLNIFNFKTPKTSRISFLFSIFDLDDSGKITKKNLIEINKLMITTKETTAEEIDCLELDRNADDILNRYGMENKSYLNKNDFEKFYNSDPHFEENMIVDIRRFTGELPDNIDFIDLIWS